MRLLLVLTLVIWKWSFCRGQCPANTGVFTGDNRFDWTIELDGVKNNSILFGSGSSVFLVAEMATIGVQIDLDPNDLIIMEVAIETKIIKEVQIFDNDDSVKAKTHPDTDTPFPEWYNSTFKFPDGFETDNLRIKVISTSKEMKVKNVFVSACVPVQWCEWGNWGDCEVSCGTGQKTRERECKCANPDLAFDCEGSPKKTETCTGKCCPVAPKWGDWKKWSGCSVTCGDGTKTRSRDCIKDPCHDGTECPGKDEQTENCNDKCCPVAPNWGDWKKWSDCSETCGDGTKTRTRDCIKDPCHDGSECIGKDAETETCNDRCCPVPPRWSDWKKWSDCSVTCGEGTKTRTRDCIKDPCHDGSDCSGKGTQTEACNERCCPVAPTWSAWKQWSDCTEECGGGTKTRKRDCNKDPCHDGSECPGKDEQTMPCNEDCCEVDPFWATWPAWEDCPVTCGGGIQERSRKCNKDKVCPTPGKDCEGISKETKTCNDQCCPIAPKWTNWKKWSACSVSCGTGIQRRKRKCKKSKTCPLKGAKCSGKKKMTQPCEQPCCRERIDFNNRDGVEVTIVGGLATRDGSELLDGSGVTIDNILLDNIDGTEKVRITFIGGSRNIIEVGLETFLSDKAMVSSNPGPWNDSNVVDPYDGFQESTFNPPGGQIDNQDQVTLQFGYPTGEISVAGLYLIVCV